MNEQAEKAIASNLQLTHKNLLQCLEEINSAQNALDRVAQRKSELKPDPSEKKKDPMNITEAIIEISDQSKEVLIKLSELQQRTNTLF